MVTNNEASRKCNTKPDLQPGEYAFMVMIPGLAKPAYVPLTALSSKAYSAPCITDIALSPGSMTNKQSRLITVDIKTENIPNQFTTYSYTTYPATVITSNTTCNVALLNSDGSQVANIDYWFEDNSASSL
jgi:hypothetical protein